MIADEAPAPPARPGRLRRAWDLLAASDPALAALILLVVLYYACTRGIFQGKASGDGFFGFMYLPSLVFHRTVQMAPAVPKMWLPYFRDDVTGRTYNPCPIGTVPFWIAPYLLGLGLERIAAPFTHVDLSGQSPFDFFMAGLGSLAAGLAGVAILFRLLRRKLGAGAARAGAIASVLATPLVWYLVTQPLYQHACAFFAVTLLVERWDAFRSDERGLTPARMALLGAIGGLAMLIRIQEVVWLLLPGMDVVRLSVRALTKRKASNGADGPPPLRTLAGGIALIAVCALVFAPQVAIWIYFFGKARTPQPPGHMRWADPAIVATIFSTRAGLLPWAPVLYLVPPGLWLARRRLGALAGALSLGFAVELWVNASAWDHWGSYTFGPRRFTDATVVFAAGVAGAWWWIAQRRRIGRALLATALALAIAMNGALMELLRANRIKSSGAWAFPASVWAGWAGAPRCLRSALEHAGDPFVQPAGWIYALAYHVPPSTFEGVVGNYLLERDCRVHAVLNHSGLSFADAGTFVPDGILGPPDAAKQVPVATRVRVLVPLFALEPVRLNVFGSFDPARGGASAVRATWNGAPVATTASGGHVTIEVPEARVRTRARTNELVLALPEGSKLSKLELESLGDYWR